MNKKYKNRSLNAELILILVVFFAITLGFILFREEMTFFVSGIVDRFGLIGLFFITLVMDTIIQPISPDLLTLGYSIADLNLFAIALVGGMASVIAGMIGYGFGRLIGRGGVDKFIGEERYKKAQSMFIKYGFWAIFIGALSPIPFSAFTWSAGVFKMPWKFFLFSIVITRLPRFLLAGYVGTFL